MRHYKILAAASAFMLGALTDVPPALSSANDELPIAYGAYGNYLSGRAAETQSEAADAIEYFEAVLDREGASYELIDRIFRLSVGSGDVDRAKSYADELLEMDQNNGLARLFAGADAIRNRAYGKASSALSIGSPNNALDKLLIEVLFAWAETGKGNSEAAILRLEELTGPAWSELFSEFHLGLIAGFAGDAETAEKYLVKTYKADSRTDRFTEAYARFFARQGQSSVAIAALDKLPPQEQRKQQIADLNDRLLNNKEIRPMVANPAAGAAEIFFGLGGALIAEGANDLGLSYQHIALHLAPNSDVIRFSLAGTYQQLKKYLAANEIYQQIDEGSPFWIRAQIMQAQNLRSLENVAEAEQILNALLARDPANRDGLEALGNLLRSEERYQEAIEAYSQMIDPDNITRPDWPILYVRGIAYERSGQWPAAEADFSKALELSPDHPLVLNYLGYSWVDQGIHLDEALKMIRKAVELRRNDGYIVDSLGWAYYRLGRYEEAVRELERAVELRPGDPLIVDHMGDALWRVGRTIEAHYKWSQVLDLQPDDELRSKIEQKLQSGLEAESEQSE